jgi:hypothetical protein
MLFMFKIALCAMRIITAMTYVWHHVVTHIYHPWCLAIHCTSSPKCKVKGCEQEFESDWQLSFDFSDKAQDDVDSPM